MSETVVNAPTTVVNVKTLSYPLRKRVIEGQYADYIYIGRPSRWGNPFVIDNIITRDQALRMFHDWWWNERQRPLRDAARKLLKGKRLACWCAPERCHGDIIAAWVDREEAPDRNPL